MILVPISGVGRGFRKQEFRNIESPQIKAALEHLQEKHIDVTEAWTDWKTNFVNVVVPRSFKGDPIKYIKEAFKHVKGVEIDDRGGGEYRIFLRGWRRL
jgi:hypothetical protein